MSVGRSVGDISRRDESTDDEAQVLHHVSASGAGVDTPRNTSSVEIGRPHSAVPAPPQPPGGEGESDPEDGEWSATAPTLRRHFTLVQLVCLFACSFSYAFIFNSVNNMVIPKEIERLAATRQSMWVGLTMGAGALSQIATPIVGAMSDRTGSRSIYLVYGAMITVTGIVLFMAVASVTTIWMLLVAHVVTSVGLSMQYSMVTALLNDHVGEEQVGKGSGTMAILAIVGSGSGYVMFGFGLPLNFSYLSYIATTLICLVICLSTIPTNPAGTPTAAGLSGDAASGKKLKWQSMTQYQRFMTDVGHALSIPSPRKHSDFFFACLGRAAFNTGLAGQVYLVYYFRDVLGAENPTQLASIVAVAALLGGIAGALPAGVISDRLGKKPVIYWSILVCVTALVSFMLVQETVLLQVMGFIYGCGNVAYLSVDYALGVQSLPRRVNSEGKPIGPPIDAAKDLGVFAMSATAGQLFGQVVYAAVLEQIGGFTSGTTGFMQYSYEGFVGIYAVGCTAFAISGIATTFIKGVK